MLVMQSRHLNGFPDMPPVRPNFSYGDSLAGLHAAFGTVMALLHRQRKSLAPDSHHTSHGQVPSLRHSAGGMTCIQRLEGIHSGEPSMHQVAMKRSVDLLQALHFDSRNVGTGLSHACQWCCSQLLSEGLGRQCWCSMVCLHEHELRK